MTVRNSPARLNDPSLQLNALNLTSGNQKLPKVFHGSGAGSPVQDNLLSQRTNQSYSVVGTNRKKQLIHNETQRVATTFL